MKRPNAEKAPGNDAAWTGLPKAINHHTITSGHNRLSKRSEISDDLGLEVHVTDMLLGKAPIPNFEGMFARATENSGTLLVDLLAGDQVLVRFMVAHQNDDVSKAAFLHLVECDVQRKGRHEPRAPYCSAAIALAGLLQPEKLYWVADYERCVAWTWLAMSQKAEGT